MVYVATTDTISVRDFLPDEVSETRGSIPSFVGTRDRIVARETRGLDAVEVINLQDAARWLAPSLQELSRMRRLSTNWESSGSAPPNRKATEYAAEVLGLLSNIDFEPTNVDPSTDEGVCVSFRQANRYGDIECFNSGQILAAVAIDGEQPLIWDVEPSQIEGAIAKINTFILG